MHSKLFYRLLSLYYFVCLLPKNKEKNEGILLKEFQQQNTLQ